MLCALMMFFVVSNAYGAVTCPSAYPDNTNASSSSDCYAWVVFYPNGSTAYPVTYNGHTYTTDYKSVDDPDNYRSTYTKAYYRNSAEYAASCAVSNGSGGTSNWCQSRAAGYYMTTIQLWEMPNVLNGGTISVLERPGWTLHVYTSGGLSTVWTKTKNGTDIVFTRSKDVLTGRTNLYAKWDPNTYNISYTLNGGTNPSDQVTTYTVSDSLNVTLKNPYRNGYKFAGWCDNSGLTNNCTTTKKITAGAYGDKTYYAKWAQITGTKTLKLFCGSGDVKTKTFTGSGTYMQINDVATECGFTNDKRDIWVCGDLSGNSSSGYSVSNQRPYQYASDKGARVGITNSVMFCSPALSISTAQYSGSAGWYLYYLQPGSNGDSGLYLRVAPIVPQPLQPVAISSFCSTIQSNAPYGTTFWWYNPDQPSDLLPTDSNYSKYNLFTTSYPSNNQLVNFATETNTINVHYGYKFGLKCEMNSNVSSYITCNGSLLRTGINNLITASRNKCGRSSSDPVYWYPNSDPSNVEQLIQPTGGGTGELVGVTGADSTLFFKYINCSKGKYAAVGAETCNENCTNGSYCPGGIYKYTGGVLGKESCPTGFSNSNANSGEDTDCWADLNTHGNGGKNTLNTEAYIVKAYYNKSSNNCNYNSGEKYLCTSDTNGYKLTSDAATNGTPYSKTGYHFDGWYKNAAGTGTQITATTNLTDDKDIYVQWEVNAHRITYKCDTSTTQTDNVHYGDTYTWRTTESVCGETGYTVSPSFTCTSEGSTVSGSATWSVTGDAVCTAEKTLNQVQITLNKNGGVGNCGGKTGATAGSITCKYNQDCVLPAWTSGACNIANDSDNTKVLIGWGENANDGTLYGLGKNIKDYVKTLTANTSTTMTLYAQWMAPDCTVAPSNANDISATVAATAAVNNIPKCTYTCEAGYSPDGYTSAIPDGNKVTKDVNVVQVFDTTKVTSTTIGLADKCLGRTYRVHLNPGTDVEETAADYYYVYNTPKTISGTDYYYWNTEITGVGDMVANNLSTDYVVTANKPGFEFAGYWSGEAGAGTKYIQEYEGADAGKRVHYIYKNEKTTTADNTINLYADWTANVYSATYDCDSTTEGSMTPGQVNITFDTEFTTAANTCVKTGYHFVGWSVSGTTSDVKSAGNTFIWKYAENKTFVAKWAPNTINLIWANGGHGTAPEPVTCIYGSTFAIPEDLLEPGWRFDDWTIGNRVINADCNIDNLGVSDDNASVTIEATWHVAPYTIKYDTNGGSAVADGHYAITDTQPYGYQLGTTTKTGYNFDGWCVYDTEQTQAVTTCNNPKTVLESGTTGNKYAYAKWTANTINLKWDRSEHGTAPIEPDTCTYGSTFTVPAALEETGWTFNGWAVNGQTFTGGQQNVECNEHNLGVSKNNAIATIKAQWTVNTINLKWDRNEHGGTAPTEPATCTYGSKFTVPGALTEAGWTFNGWAVNGQTFTGGQQNVECNEHNLGVSKNNAIATITAQWDVIEYTITYHTNSGTMTGSDINEEIPKSVYTQQYTVENSSIVLISPVRDGFVFGGWYEDEDFAGESVGNNITSADYLRDISLYARWKVHCGNGYYLRADTEVCEQCKEGYYCVADDHFINHPYDQGLNSCSEKTSGGFEHSGKGKDSIHWCFAKLTLNGNGGKTAGNVESFDVKAYNNSAEGDESCQYDNSYPMCISPYDKTYFKYALHPDVIDNPTPFTRLGYDFLGWCTSSDSCGEDTVKDGEKLKGDQLLYAQWKIKEYDIIYNDVLIHVDGTKTTKTRPAPDEDQSTYTIESSFNFANPSKPAVDEGLGWVFEGWYDDVGLTNRVYGIPAGQMGDMPVYAKWTPKNARVDFYCEPTTKKSYSGQVGSKLDVERCGSEENPGWACSGDPDFEENYTKLIIPDNGTVCKPGYRITYLGDGIQGTTNIMIGTNIKLVPNTYTSDLEVIFPSRKFMNNFKVRPGYAFTGWFYNYDETSNKFSNKATGIARGSSGHKTVYAQWSPNEYRATYDCDSTTAGSITPVSKNIKYDEDFITASNVNTCVKKGYVFDSWRVVRTGSVRKAVGTEDAGSVAVNNNFTWQYDEDKTFIAEWTPITYEVVFDGNGATGGSMDNQQFVYDTEQPLATNAFTKDDYKFVGWCDDWDVAEETCAGTMYDDEQAVSNLTSENGTTIKLYAMWALQDYTITYNVLKDEDSGTWRVESDLTPATYTAESASTLPDSIATTRTGYTFDGWYDNPDLTGTAVTTIPAGSTGDKLFYAKWKLVDYDITYYVYYFDDTAWQTDNLSPATYNIEDEEIEFETLDNSDGYVFRGWCKVNAHDYPNCEPISTFTPTVENIGEISSLYAKWDYKITYILNGGVGVEPEIYKYGVGVSSLPLPIREGYTFAGWYRNENLSGNRVEFISDDEWGPITLYAKWEFNCASGKWVHVGDGENDKMCLSPVKPEGADAVLGIMVGNTPYYVRLSERGDNPKTISNNSNTKLNVQIGETVYNAHDASIE